MTHDGLYDDEHHDETEKAPAEHWTILICVSSFPYSMHASVSVLVVVLEP